MPQSETQRVDDLLASLTEGMLGDLPKALQDQSIRIERILLELVRPRSGPATSRLAGGNPCCFSQQSPYSNSGAA